MVKSPIGIQIFKGKKASWKVAKQLDSGACAAVHLLEDMNGSPTEFAIKLAPLPKDEKNKGKSRKESKEKTNERLLYYESLIYYNHIQDIQGIFVPKLPPPPTGHGSAEGYAYLILERMARPLLDVVTMLHDGRKKTAKTIGFGPIAVRLVSCVEAIHERRHVVVDIKPENFMLACGDDRELAPDQIAARIRILDFGLVESLSSVGSHRPNDGTRTLAGTPMYASLNVHNKATPSRRDDLEGLGYVISEIIMKLASGDASQQLPWSIGKSDEEIGRLKQDYVPNINSAFYSQLGNEEVAKLVFEFLNEVRSYKYKQKPDYEKLKEMLIRMHIPVSAGDESAKYRKRQATRGRNDACQKAATSTRKRMTRSQANASEGSQPKIRKDGSYMETDVLDLDGETYHRAAFVVPRAEDEESFETAMEWEATDGNETLQSADLKLTPEIGLTVRVEAGPHKGKTVHLVKGTSETIIVGRDPSGEADTQTLVLSDDDGVDKSHIRMELVKIKKVVSVKVTDLYSSSGSFVGSNRIRKGKDQKLYLGETVQIGNSLLSVQKLNFGRAATEVQPSAARKLGANRHRANIRRVHSKVETQQSEPELPHLKRKGIKLFVVEGPHEGETFELDHGGVEHVVLGSKPSSRAGEILSLDRDSALQPTHLKLDLVVQKKVTFLAVTDKSSGGTQVNRQKINKCRAFIMDRIKIGNTLLELRSL